MRGPLRVWKDSDYLESNLLAAISLAEQIPGVEAQIQRHYSNPDAWDWARMKSDLSSVVEFYPEFTIPFEAKYKECREKFQREARQRNSYLALKSSKEALETSLSECRKYRGVQNMEHFAACLGILMACLQYGLTQNFLFESTPGERIDTQSKESILKTEISRIVLEIKSKHQLMDFSRIKERLRLIPYEEKCTDTILGFFVHEIRPLFG